MPAYNGFPATYQPMYYGQYQMPQQTAQNNSGIIWISGEAGAKAYLVAPNTTVALFDSENQTIYLKSADASGMPSIKTLDYTIRDMPQTHQMPVSGQFATVDDITAIRDEIARIKEELANVKPTVSNDGNKSRQHPAKV